jgi:hypothetical protein
MVEIDDLIGPRPEKKGLSRFAIANTARFLRACCSPGGRARSKRLVAEIVSRLTFEARRVGVVGLAGRIALRGPRWIQDCRWRSLRRAGLTPQEACPSVAAQEPPKLRVAVAGVPLHHALYVMADLVAFSGAVHFSAPLESWADVVSPVRSMIYTALAALRRGGEVSRTRPNLIDFLTFYKADLLIAYLMSAQFGRWLRNRPRCGSSMLYSADSIQR